jgi:hypothetical protein
LYFIASRGRSGATQLTWAERLSSIERESFGLIAPESLDTVSSLRSWSALGRKTGFHFVCTRARDLHSSKAKNAPEVPPSGALVFLTTAPLDGERLQSMIHHNADGSGLLLQPRHMSRNSAISLGIPEGRCAGRRRGAMALQASSLRRG